MIVTAIIGILTTFAMPIYRDYTIRSQIAEGLSVAGGAKSALTEYYQDRGVFPADNNEAGLEVALNISGQYVGSVSVAGAVITITFGNDANALINGQTVILTAFDNTGSVIFSCASGGGVLEKHLPSSCR
jgi:type IV pilus assembly protein PilA